MRRKKNNILILIIRLLFLISFALAFGFGLIKLISDHEFIRSSFITALTSIISLAITYIPDLVSHKDIMIVPVALQTCVTIFTFMAMFLGDMLNFYYRFPFWDSILHLSSGIMFSMTGFMLFVSLNRDSSIRNQLNPASVVLFAICFSIACGAIWEIYEFTADSLIGTNTQRWQSTLSHEQWLRIQNTSNSSNPGLIDTMKDIINDTIGTVISIPIILPLIKHENKYVNPNITAEQLLAESKHLSLDKCFIQRDNPIDLSHDDSKSDNKK